MNPLTTVAPQASTPDLTPVEARILACLMEKQRTTPDQYPLTLNALVLACNQKTSRDPLMALEMGEVGHVVNTLRDRGLIHASFAGRTERYDHKMASSYRLDRQEAAARHVCAEAGRLVGQTAVQLHGGIGVTDELDVAHYFKRLTMLPVWFADNGQPLDRFQAAAA